MMKNRPKLTRILDAVDAFGTARYFVGLYTKGDRDIQQYRDAAEQARAELMSALAAWSGCSLEGIAIADRKRRMP